MRAALIAAILGFAPPLLDPFHAFKAIVLRTVGLALLAMAAADVTAWRRAGGATRMLDLAVVAWCVVALASTLAGVSPGLSLLGEIEQREGLVTTLALAGVYAGVRRSHASVNDAARTLGVMGFAAAAAAAYALIQRAGGDPLVWSGADVYVTGSRAVLRPGSTLGNPILLGAVSAAALAGAIVRLATARRAGGGLVAIAVLAMAVAATMSRSAALAAAAGSLIALLGARAAGAPARCLVLVAIAAALPALAWVVLADAGAFGARLGEGFAATASGGARFEIARSALALWRSHPWLGTGPDTFGLMFPSVQTAAYWSTQWWGVPVHAHSAALQVVATLGLAGTVVGCAWFVAFGFAIARTWRSGAAHAAELAAIGVALAVAGALNPVGLAGATLFAVVTGLAACAAAPATDVARPHARIAIAIGALALIAGGVWGVRELHALSAAGEGSRAFEALETALPTARAPIARHALEEASRAARALAIEDEVWRLACDAALAGVPPVLEDADRAARAAVADEPRRASNHQRLGNALAARAAAQRMETGSWEVSRALADSARAAFAQARTLAPRDGFVLIDLARAELRLGEPARAREAARAITALYPDAASGHAAEAGAAIALGDRVGALTALLAARAAPYESEPAVREAVERALQALTAIDSAGAARR